MKDLFEDDQEPSFSLHEFKKWLSKQNESKEEPKKDDLKEKFKKIIKDKIKKKHSP